MELKKDRRLLSPTKKVAEEYGLTGPLGRDRYLLERQRIQEEIGDLNQILRTLGINQRRACQLLLVDPSAWTRWNKTEAPPHVYQALRWLIRLKKTQPEVLGPVDFGGRLDQMQTKTQAKIGELEKGLAMVEKALTLTPSAPVALEAANADQAWQVAVLSRELVELRKKVGELEEKIKKTPRSKTRSKVVLKKKSKVKTKSKLRPFRMKSKNKKVQQRKTKKNKKKFLPVKKSRR